MVLLFMVAAPFLLLEFSLFPEAVWSASLQLNGKTEFIDIPVKNEYAGTVLQVLKQDGDPVLKDEAVVLYQLDANEVEAIRNALDGKRLLEKDSQLAELERQLHNQARRVEQVRDSVRAGYETSLRLDSEEATLDLCQSQLQEAQRARSDLSASLALSQKEISEKLGGLKVTRNKVPDTIPLRAPYDGAVSKMNLRPGQIITTKSECFRITAKSIYIKARVHAEDFQKLHTGDSATVSLQAFPGKTFPAVLFRLPAKPVDKGSMANSYYEVLFRLVDHEVFVREGLSARVTVP